MRHLIQAVTIAYCLSLHCFGYAQGGVPSTLNSAAERYVTTSESQVIWGQPPPRSGCPDLEYVKSPERFAESMTKPGEIYRVIRDFPECEYLLVEHDGGALGYVMKKYFPSGAVSRKSVREQSSEAQVSTILREGQRWAVICRTDAFTDRASCSSTIRDKTNGMLFAVFRVDDPSMGKISIPSLAPEALVQSEFLENFNFQRFLNPITVRVDQNPPMVLDLDDTTGFRLRAKQLIEEMKAGLVLHAKYEGLLTRYYGKFSLMGFTRAYGEAGERLKW